MSTEKYTSNTASIRNNGYVPRVKVNCAVVGWFLAITLLFSMMVLINYSGCTFELYPDWKYLPAGNSSDARPTIYIVTPTIRRPSRMPDLTRTANTLRQVPDVFWLVVEDGEELSPRVADLLRRSGIPYSYILSPEKETHLRMCFPLEPAPEITPRYASVKWLLQHARRPGWLYFADDDNSYDLRLFEEIRKIKKVGMWPSGLLGPYFIGAPILRNGRVVSFHEVSLDRTFWVDFSNFAISLDLLFRHPHVDFSCRVGHEEDAFLTSLGVTLEDIEPLADRCTQVLVWHTKNMGSSFPLPDDLAEVPNSQDTNLPQLYQYASEEV